MCVHTTYMYMHAHDLARPGRALGPARRRTACTVTGHTHTNDPCARVFGSPEPPGIPRCSWLSAWQDSLLLLYLGTLLSQDPLLRSVDLCAHEEACTQPVHKPHPADSCGCRPWASCACRKGLRHHDLSILSCALVRPLIVLCKAGRSCA